MQSSKGKVHIIEIELKQLNIINYNIGILLKYLKRQSSTTKIDSKTIEIRPIAMIERYTRDPRNQGFVFLGECSEGCFYCQTQIDHTLGKKVSQLDCTCTIRNYWICKCSSTDSRNPCTILFTIYVIVLLLWTSQQLWKVLLNKFFFWGGGGNQDNIFDNQGK